MCSTSKLSCGDASNLMRLLVELPNLRDLTMRRQYALRHLASLTEARAGLIVGIRLRRRRMRVLDHTLWGLDPAQQTIFTDYLHNLNPPHPAAQTITERLQAAPVGQSLALRRQDLVDNQQWYASRYVQNVRRPCGLDASVYTYHRADPEGLSYALVMYRAWRQRVFGTREQRLLRMFWSVACSLLAQDEATGCDRADEPDPLPPRLAQVLDCLHQGMTNAQIADTLCLSPHTINDHIKRLHKRFDAHNRAELLARSNHRRQSLSESD